MRASLLTIGDELLIGQVTDTNAAWIGAFLSENGVKLTRHITVGDSAVSIHEGLEVATRGVDVVLLTGGLGPTNDDITLESLAKYLNRPQEFNEQTWERITHIFENIIKRPLHESLKRQAMQPEGATALVNTQGTAPGILIEEAGILYIAMPGVPREMKYLMQAEVLPILMDRFPATPGGQITIHTAGWGETQIAEAIAEVEATLPTNFRIAYLPSLGTVRVRIDGQGADRVAIHQELAIIRNLILSKLPKDLVFGEGDINLVASVVEQLKNQEATVSVAESCTGGMAGHLITLVPGASAVFQGGIISYDNAIKSSLLGVSEKTLTSFGAVSEQVVTEMVAGALAKLGTTYAIATSGIAGPSGGTPDKPVGTIWIAAGSKHGTKTRLLSLGKDRETNIEYTAIAAIDLLRRFMLQANHHLSTPEIEVNRL